MKLLINIIRKIQALVKYRRQQKRELELFCQDLIRKHVISRESNSTKNSKG